MNIDYVKAFEMDRKSKVEDDGTEGDEADIDGLNIEIDELEDHEEDSESDRPDETERGSGPALQAVLQEMPVFF